MAANRPALGHPAGYVHLISSAALDQPDPDQPVCSGALLFEWLFRVADQASMILMDSCAYRASLVMYQISASAYAAIASCRSSLHPLSGLELGPQPTSVRGVGFRAS